MGHTARHDTTTAGLPQRQLGRDGPLTGAIGFGAMGMSWVYNDPDADTTGHREVIRAAVSAGANLIDTSDLYGPFTNEDLIGRAIHDIRDQVILATKGGLETTDPAMHIVERDGRPRHLRAAITGSLRRLQTDTVDIYYLHRVDDDVPLADQWGTLATFVQEGKARRLGLCEVTIEQLEQAHSIHPVSCVQSELSLWTRENLKTLVPWCAAHDVAFIAYSPLGRGYLTGAINADTQFSAADFRSRHPRFTDNARRANEQIITIIRAVAARHHSTPAQIALAWVLAQGDHIVAIWDQTTRSTPREPPGRPFDPHTRRRRRPRRHPAPGR